MNLFVAINVFLRPDACRVAVHRLVQHRMRGYKLHPGYRASIVFSYVLQKNDAR